MNVRIVYVSLESDTTRRAGKVFGFADEDVPDNKLHPTGAAFGLSHVLDVRCFSNSALTREFA